MKSHQKVVLIIQLIVLLFGISLKVSAQVATPFSGPSTTTAPPTQASNVQQVVCNGNQIVIKTAAVASAYQWYKQNPSGTMQLVQSGASITYTETSTGAGHYIYTLVTINANGCSSNPSDPFDIFVLPPLTPTITTSNSNICANNQTTTVLTASPVNDANYSYTYQWARNGVAIAGATSSTYTVSETTAGTDQYTVTVSYVLNPTCTATSPAQTITVVPIPAKPVITL